MLSSTNELQAAAIEYAGYWFAKEQTFIRALSGKNEAERLEGLKRAAGYFRIARNLPNAYDVERGLPRLKPALDILDRYYAAESSDESLIETVSRLRRELGNVYGGRDLLSAATKFLWLGHKRTVIIFDSEVRTALGTPYADFESYVAAWRATFSDKLADIQRLRSSLPDRIQPLIEEPWFQRRVFDIYMWRAGKGATSSTLHS